MQTVSSTYTSILANGGWHECKLDINGTAYDMEKIVSMQTSAALWDGAASVGNTIAGTIDVSLIASSNAVPTMAELRPYVRAVNDSQQSEWLPKGVYYIDTREYDKETGILYLSGMDAMLKGEQDYMQYGDQGYWPRTDIAILYEISSRLGLDSYTYEPWVPYEGEHIAGYYYELIDGEYVLTEDEYAVPGKTYYKAISEPGIDPRTLDIITNNYSIGYPGIGEEAYTVREVLGYIGSMYAGNWIINDQGLLQLIVLGDIPSETFYLINEDGDRITLGGDRLVMT